MRVWCQLFNCLLCVRCLGAEPFQILEVSRPFIAAWLFCTPLTSSRSLMDHVTPGACLPHWHRVANLRVGNWSNVSWGGESYVIATEKFFRVVKVCPDRVLYVNIILQQSSGLLQRLCRDNLEGAVKHLAAHRKEEHRNEAFHSEEMTRKLHCGGVWMSAKSPIRLVGLASKYLPAGIRQRSLLSVCSL